VIGADPEAATPNVADCPTVTDTLEGCCVITGADSVFPEPPGIDAHADSSARPIIATIRSTNSR